MEGRNNRGRDLGLRVVGGLKINDVTQQDLGVVEFVAPNDNGLEGEGAFAQARDHGFAAGLNAFCNGDLALAREQLNGAHLAQIHAHGIVGPLGRLRPRGGGGGGRRLGCERATPFRFGLLLRILTFVAFFVLHDIDAHVGEHRHGVLDLL